MDDGHNHSCTCILKYSLSVCAGDKNIKVITYFSNNCPEQNRNTNVATSLLYTLSKLPHIKTIHHKFLEWGHSHRECDSFHSTIEQAKKHTSGFAPLQRSTVISMAWRKNLYFVVPLKLFYERNFMTFIDIWPAAT